LFVNVLYATIKPSNNQTILLYYLSSRAYLFDE